MAVTVLQCRGPGGEYRSAKNGPRGSKGFLSVSLLLSIVVGDAPIILPGWQIGFQGCGPPLLRDGQPTDSSSARGDGDILHETLQLGKLRFLCCAASAIST